MDVSLLLVIMVTLLFAIIGMTIMLSGQQHQKAHCDGQLEGHPAESKEGGKHEGVLQRWRGTCV